MRTHPQHRGKGIGRRLYQHFFEVVSALSCTKVLCITSPVNKSSIAFHRHMGFEILPGQSLLVSRSHLTMMGGVEHMYCFAIIWREVEQENQNMALDFRAQMFGGNKRKINNQLVIEAVLQDATRVCELFECVKDKDEYVRMRASDALEKVCRSDPSIVQPLKTRILDEMSVIDQPSVQWHYAQIVDKLQLNAQETAKVIHKLQSNFETYDDWITHNITMEVLGNFALHDEDLRAYLVPKLEELSKDRRVSISSRALKILNKLEKRN